MASQVAWEAANQYASRVFILITLVLNIIQIILFLVLEIHLAFIIMGGLITIAVFLIIPFTESFLKKISPVRE